MLSLSTSIEICRLEKTRGELKSGSCEEHSTPQRILTYPRFVFIFQWWIHGCEEAWYMYIVSISSRQVGCWQVGLVWHGDGSIFFTGRRNNSVMGLVTVGLMVSRHMRPIRYYAYICIYVDHSLLSLASASLLLWLKTWGICIQIYLEMSIQASCIMEACWVLQAIVPCERCMWGIWVSLNFQTGNKTSTMAYIPGMPHNITILHSISITWWLRLNVNSSSVKLQ